MHKWLDNSDTFMQSTQNGGTSASVLAEKFIRTLKDKIYKKITSNDSKFYLDYLKKLLNEYNNTYHRSAWKKPIDADYSALTEYIGLNHKAPKFKVSDRTTNDRTTSNRIAKYKNIFSKGYTTICQEKYLLLILC